MKKRSHKGMILAISGQQQAELLFVTGQMVTMRVNCKTCDEPLITLRARILGVCAGCLKKAGVEMGRILVVDPPTAETR